MDFESVNEDIHIFCNGDDKDVGANQNLVEWDMLSANPATLAVPMDFGVSVLMSIYFFDI